MGKTQIGTSAVVGATIYQGVVGLSATGCLVGVGFGLASKGLAYLINEYLLCRGPINHKFPNSVEHVQSSSDEVYSQIESKHFTREFKLLTSSIVSFGLVIAVAAKVGLATGALFSSSGIFVAGSLLYATPRAAHYVTKAVRDPHFLEAIKDYFDFRSCCGSD